MQAASIHDDTMRERGRRPYVVRVRSDVRELVGALPAPETSRIPVWFVGPDQTTDVDDDDWHDGWSTIRPRRTALPRAKSDH